MYVFCNFWDSIGFDHNRGFGEICRNDHLLLIQKYEISWKKNSPAIQTKAFGPRWARLHDGKNAEPNGGGRRNHSAYGIKRICVDVDRQNADPPKFSAVKNSKISRTSNKIQEFQEKLK